MKLELLDKSQTFLIPPDEKARRVTNTAPDANPGITPAELSAGVTLEKLQSLKVPVYAYQTQVTIHGTFIEVSPLVAGYHLLTRNGNGTLGVRYAAIDGGKKKTLAECCRRARAWTAFLSSSGLDLQRRVPDIATGRQWIAEIPAGVYGTAGLYRDPMSGNVYACVYVGAIRAGDLWPVIAYFAPGFTGPEVLAAAMEAEEREAEARRAAYAAERKARQADTAERLEAARLATLAAGRVPVPAGWNPGKGSVFSVLGADYSGEIKLRKITLAMRGPVLCSVRDGEKGRKVESYQLAAWEKAAGKGLVFLPRDY